MADTSCICPPLWPTEHVGKHHPHCRDDDRAERSGVTMSTCQMIVAHHPDCECQVCRSHQDDTCDEPAVGFTKNNSNRLEVCEDHAVMAADDPEAYGVLTCYDTDGAQAVRRRVDAMPAADSARRERDGKE